MADKYPKRPRDPNQLAKRIVDLATGDAAETKVTVTDAQRFAREGGLKGGRARAAALSPKQRKAIAKKAALIRWAAKSE